MKEIIERISQEMISQVVKLANTPLLSSGLKYAANPFSMNYFNNLRLDSSIKDIAFIDGGSSEIISSNSFSLYFIRTAAVVYSENVKTISQVKNFFVLTKSDYSDDLKYVSKVFHLNHQSENFIIKFDASDKTLKDGINNGEISKVGSIIRRFLELDLASEVAEKLSPGSTLILDGSLQCTFTGEEKYMNNLVNSAIKNDVLLLALSKTNSLLTDTGTSVESVLRNMATDLNDAFKMWFYGPLMNVNDDSYSADVYMVKLHKRSKHIFKVDVSNRFESINYSKLFGCLALNSGDPVFLGYPYGLIKADEMARIDSEQSSHLKMRFMKYTATELMESSKNAHSILDKIKFG